MRMTSGNPRTVVASIIKTNRHFSNAIFLARLSGGIGSQRLLERIENRQQQKQEKKEKMRRWLSTNLRKLRRRIFV